MEACDGLVHDGMFPTKVGLPLPPMSRNALPWIIFSGLVLVWGSSFILMKIALDGFTGVQIGALRLIFAALFITVVAWPARHEFQRRDIGSIIIVGLFGNSIPYLLFPVAVGHIPSGLVGVANSTTPLFALIIGALAFSRKMNVNNTMGVIIGLIGGLVLLNPFNLDTEVGREWPYLMMAISAAACYGLSVNTMGSKLPHLSPRAMTLLAMWVAAIPSAGILIATEFWTQFDGSIAVSKAVSSVAFLGIVGTGVAMILFTRLIHMTSALMGASTTYFIPIVALAWGLLDGENLLWNHYLGMAAILVGVYLVNRRGKEA